MTREAYLRIINKRPGQYGVVGRVLGIQYVCSFDSWAFLTISSHKGHVQLPKDSRVYLNTVGLRLTLRRWFTFLDDRTPHFPQLFVGSKVSLPPFVSRKNITSMIQDRESRTLSQPFWRTCWFQISLRLALRGRPYRGSSYITVKVVRAPNRVRLLFSHHPPHHVSPAPLFGSLYQNRLFKLCALCTHLSGHK